MLMAVLAVAAAQPLTVERVAVLMRHGVRPPTKTPAMPDGIADRPWPAWDVAAGELTRHGAAAVRLLGAADRRAWGALAGAAGCPAPASIALSSDSDQRTIATGDAWAEGFAPGCRIANRHAPQGVTDTAFASIESGLTDYDARAADAAVARALPTGGIAEVEKDARGTLDRLDAILCGAASAPQCGVARAPSRIEPAGDAARPGLKGMLDRGSTAAQILLLEYAEGKPMAEVGWGRATAADVSALGRLHATEFALLARPRYIAARNLAPIAKALRDALAGPAAAKVTMIVGHDTNIANMAGLLDVHWRATGFAADDPAPGGALVAERVRDGRGARFVRLSYRVQPLEAIRALRPDVQTIVLHMPSCDPLGSGLCPLATFTQALDRSARLLKR